MTPSDFSQPCAAVNPTRPDGALPYQASKRVLIVDDENAIRELLAEVLRDEGYAVLTATNGAQALAVLHTHAVDAIVLDLAMPVMSGVVFRHQQLLQPTLATIPVIVLSADHDLEKQSQALRPFAWLAKPFQLQEVLATLASACAVST
jgi:two-component system chemotaxis response regulator CheY